MPTVFFISDLHLGHKRILEFSPSRKGTTIAEHDHWLKEQWNSVVKPHDLVWVLGDVAFGTEPLKILAEMNGHKNLVRGNHDKLNTQTYLKYFNNVYGLVKKYNLWLSHAPIHELSLRDRVNVHGHVHANSVRRVIPEDVFPLDSMAPRRNCIVERPLDPRYFNVSVEALDGVPISLGEINERLGLK